MTIPFVQPVTVRIAPWAMDAAVEAAGLLCTIDPHDPAGCQAFREAKAMLASMIPADMDARDVISAVVRWKAVNEIEAAFQDNYPIGDQQ